MVGETLTAVRSHPVMEGNSESGDTVDLRAKMESTDRRAIGGILMPPGACRGSRGLEAEGRARLLRSRPPDDDEGSPGGRALSAQSPTGTVMGLLARRRSLAGKLGWHCPSATWGSGLGCRQSPTFARARGCSELHCAPSQSDCEVGFLAVNVGIVKTRFLVVLLRSGPGRDGQ